MLCVWVNLKNSKAYKAAMCSTYDIIKPILTAQHSAALFYRIKLVIVLTSSIILVKTYLHILPIIFIIKKWLLSHISSFCNIFY